MIFKDDWNKSKERLKALWEREIIDRCCISIAAPKDHKTDVSVFALGECNENDPADLCDYWMNPERILKRNLERMEKTYFGGEAIPQIMLNFGTSGHANYFGGEYSFVKETIWNKEVIEDWDDFDLTLDRNSEFLKNQLEIARYLSDEGKEKFFVSMPDNCGTIDAIGHLRGTEKVLFDMIDSPENIKNAISTINEGWKEVSEEFFKITSKCNEGGSTVGWMDTWAEGRHAQMQCDMSVMFSPTQYEEFVVPEIQEQMQWIEYPVYHFDGKEQIAHLDHILSLDKLKMIQWTHVAGQEPPTAFMPVLKRIQEAGKCLLLFPPIKDIPELLSELSSRGLYLHAFASSEEEGREVIKYVEKNTKE